MIKIYDFRGDLSNSYAEKEPLLQSIPGLLCDDISGGKEPVRIPLINDTQSEATYPKFEYISKYCKASTLALDYLQRLTELNLNQWSGCNTTKNPFPKFQSCGDDGIAYDKFGSLNATHFVPIVECSPDCSNPACALPSCAPDQCFFFS